LDYKADRARERALDSRDELLALRAAETHYKLRGKGGFGRGDETNPDTRVSAEDIAQALLAIGSGAMPQEGLSEHAVTIAKDLLCARDITRQEQDLYAREQILAEKEQDLRRREQAVAVREREEKVVVRPNGSAMGLRETSNAIPDWA
jgi:hypothetical protein